MPQIMPPSAMAEQLLTLTDIARHFSLPESTTRYYCKRFAPFLPVCGEGRRRRYRQEALAVIAAIIEHMRASRTAASVEEALGRQFPRTLDALTPVASPSPSPAPTPVCAEAEAVALPQAALQLLEQQTRAMEGIAASLNLLAQQQAKLQHLSDAAQQALTENAALRREIADMRTLLHNSEEVHQGDLDQIRTWVGRIMRSRPSPQNPPLTNTSASTADKH